MTEFDEAGTDRCTRWLRIEPLDALFFGDGRPFGPASHAVSGLPGPQAVAGALRTEMLRRAGIDFKYLAALIRSGKGFGEAVEGLVHPAGGAIAAVRFRGPYFGRKDRQGGFEALVYRACASLRAIADKTDRILRLDPMPETDIPAGWTPPEAGMVPLWVREREALKRLDSGWMSAAGMSRFLAGGLPRAGDLIADGDLYCFEERTGIAVDAKGGAAADRMIYAARRLVLRPDVCLWARVEGPHAALALLPRDGESRLLPFGGEGLRAAFTASEAPHGTAPAQGSSAVEPGGGRLIVLTTPAFLDGWRPDGVNVVAAAIQDHVAVSGWDLARGGPRPTRFAAAAGSVFFLPPGSADAPREIGEPEDTALGWGKCLTGVWRHA
ncbi:type III-B CRISPR module-associated Cmr3 family protein [Nitratireductor sp. XY-223]|uniref:type III-B CRISPR module-associated Cmr3 family protein n=1 Tax=Nitratireductor sp. XY-223 TaxID=2561926 RepID=UPI0010A9B57F|nr:type III-B CRISPR module-associated Cmr3 family protein [Nitratireductor sp. XY-223]